MEGFRLQINSQHALVGLVAGLIGVVGGSVLAWAVVVHGMEIPWVHRPGALAAGLFGTVVLSVAAGLLASVRALGRRPVEVLRADKGPEPTPARPGRDASRRPSTA